MAEMYAFMDAGMDEPVEELLKRPQGRRYSLSASTEDLGSDGVLSIALSDLSLDASVPLSDFARTDQAAKESEGALRKLATPGKAAVSHAFEVEEEGEQTKLREWARWQDRRQQRLGRRSVLREKYISMNAECRLGFCSSDCSQCKAPAGESR